MPLSSFPRFDDCVVIIWISLFYLARLAKRRRHLFDLRSRLRLDVLYGIQKIGVSHPRAQISPTHALEHCLAHLFALVHRKLSSARLHKALDIELCLPLDSLVQKRTDLAVFLEG